MSDYKMEIKGQLGLGDFSNINDFFGIVDKNDGFTISFTNGDNNDIQLVNTMLKGNSFCISNEGYDSNGNYYINTYRKD